MPTSITDRKENYTTPSFEALTGDAQIYLKKDKYFVSTFEPVHKLIEEATQEDYSSSRITIGKCIEYLECQKSVLEYNINELPNEKLKQFQYDEYSKEIIAKNIPSELVYEDKQIISPFLQFCV